MSKDTRNQDKHPFGRCPKRKPCHKKKTDDSFADKKKSNSWRHRFGILL